MLALTGIERANSQFTFSLVRSKCLSLRSVGSEMMLPKPPQTSDVAAQWQRRAEKLPRQPAAGPLGRKPDLSIKLNYTSCRDRRQPRSTTEPAQPPMAARASFLGNRGNEL